MEHSEEYYQTISEFHMGMRHDDSDTHWIDVSSDFSFLGAKKSILVLPGSGTSSSEAANGMCKLVEKMLPPELRENYQICSLYYANSSMQQRLTVIRAEKIFNDFIVPLVAYKDENDDLQRLDTLQAAHNLRHLTVVTHCYGGYIMQEIDRLLDQTMADLSYTPQERELIHKQLFVVQHNNIDEDLGKTDFGSSHLIRISTSDDHVCYQDALNPSFCFYVGSSSFQDEDLMYVRLSDHTRVLVADRITIDGRKEHNGGYWLESCYKTETGQKEEKIFQSIFKEVITSDTLIEDFEQIARHALRNDRSLQKIFVPAMLKGRALEDGFKANRRLIEGNFEDLKSKILNNADVTDDLSDQYPEVLMAEDSKGMFLMDYAIQSQNYQAAEQLAYYMKREIPREPYLSHNRNQKDARCRIDKWAQNALDSGHGKALQAIAGLIGNAIDFDYAKANTHVILAAAQVYSQYLFPDDRFTQDIYCRNLAAIYAQSERYPESAEAQKAKDVVEHIIFKHYVGGFEHSNYARELLKTYCAGFKAKELLKKVEKQWPYVEQRPTDKIRQGASRL